VIVSWRPSITIKKSSSSPFTNSTCTTNNQEWISEIRVMVRNRMKIHSKWDELTVQGWCLILPRRTAAYLRIMPDAASLSMIWFFMRVSFYAISMDSCSWCSMLLLISSMIILRQVTSSLALYSSCSSLSISNLCLPFKSSSSCVYSVILLHESFAFWTWSLAIWTC